MFTRLTATISDGAEPSPPVLASSLPSGLNATALKPLSALALAGRGAPAGRPVTGFHSRTYPSASALASSLPSGLNATPYTPVDPPLGPGKVSAGSGAPAGRVVTGFHNRT